uniref:Cytochrome c oxidase subunit NDUFA4 n=1 Tax=Ursus americanus TaxID=9643 RepID=A0A452SND2_URSAM
YLRQLLDSKYINSFLDCPPPFIFIGGGGTGAALYVLHLALSNPDVSWGRKNNLEPWNKLGPNDQYKFYSVNGDYSKLKKKCPNF